MPDDKNNQNKTEQNGTEEQNGANSNSNGSGDQNGTQSTEEQNTSQNGNESGSEGTQGFTQEDIDRIVTERLRRDRETREEEERKRAERESMDEVDRVKAEKADALAQAEEHQSLAAQADRKLDLVIEALKQGVDAAAVDRDFLALVGAFSSTEETPEQSVKKLLTKFPALTGGSGRSSSSSDGAGSGGGSSKLPSFKDYSEMDPDAKTKFWNEHPEKAQEYHDKLASADNRTGASLWNF